MWMASYMGGIFVVDRQRLVQTVTAATASSPSATATLVADVHLADHGANALSALHVGQLVTDAQGMVWASTGNHVDRINPKTMKVEAVPADDVVNYLMADARGNVWMGSNGKVRCYVMEGKATWPVKPREWQIGGKVGMSERCRRAHLGGERPGVLCHRPRRQEFQILDTPGHHAHDHLLFAHAQRQVVVGGDVGGYVSAQCRRAHSECPSPEAHARWRRWCNGRQLPGAMADGGGAARAATTVV